MKEGKNNSGALLLTHDGKMHSVPWNGGGLDELRLLINCHWVEAVRLRDPLAGMSIWCDEEGKLKPHVANTPASLLYRYLCGGDYMAGRCVILADTPEGDCAPLSDSQLIAVNRAIDFLTFHMVVLRGVQFEATGPRCELVEL